MVVVNKFNVNNKQVTLDADIIENMSANDVSYDDSFQYDENTVGDKLSELEYDVTANNDGVTFASLSALLSDENLSTLIPTSVRHGGMSIRFVQSSDNKYAQYFLTKDEWSVSETDWEKTNLEEEISQLQQDFGKFLSEDENPVYSLSGYVSTNGVIFPTENAQNTGFLNLNGRKSVECVGFLSSSGLIIAFYDYRKNFISGIQGNATNGYKYTATAPENAVYVIFSNYGKSKHSAKIFASSDSVVEEFLDDINKINNNLYPYFAPLTISGYISADNGNVLSTSHGKCTDFVDISQFISVQYRNGGGNETVASVAFYDENKTFIPSLVIRATDSLVGIIDLTAQAYANAKYLRLTYYKYLTPDYTEFIGILRTSANVIERLNRLCYDNANGIKILVFGDSITDCTSITINGNNQTTAYALRHPGNSYVDAGGHTIAYDMWPYLINQYILSSDLRCYARSGASYKNKQIQPGEERRNLSYQIDVAFNDLTNPNNVFPTVGNYVPDVVIFALGTNDGPPNDTYETAMAKTIWNNDNTDVDIEATLANLDLTKFNEAVRYAFLRVKAQFPYSIVMCVLPIQRVKSPNEMGTLHDDLMKMAKRHSIIVIDGAFDSGILDDLNTHNGLGLQLKDGLHPNDKGQNIMARMILSAINRNWVNPVFMNQ